MITAKFRPSKRMLRISFRSLTNKYDIQLYNKVLDVCCDVCELRKRDVLSKKRFRNLVLARNMVAYILHVAYMQRPGPIASFLNRDRTTILHGLETFVNDIEMIPNYMETYESCLEQLPEPNTIYALQ